LSLAFRRIGEVLLTGRYPEVDQRASAIHAQFRTTRLLSVFDLFEAEAEALQSFGDNP